ncbi:uncharacterized protein VTP21DRAFT_2822 [Calcarisporiella thermophila]|uniref:uncharacterized protein n=1 Tax=Calcarisporiella thermophila TaxID=911321 RepID=UPI003744777D
MKYRSLNALLLVHGLFSLTTAFEISSSGNLVNYWGQNSYGAANPSDKQHWQKPIAHYCQDDTVSVLTVAFMNVFNAGTNRLPEIDLSNQCGEFHEGTQLRHCPETGRGIKACQEKGKIVLLSMGGAAGAYGFANDQQAKDFAHTVWNLFLGGKHSKRPFDDAVLDGIDLDIEGGSTVGYDAFVTELRRLYKESGRRYYIAAAPQCPYPDGFLDQALNNAWFDMVYVQFYNNYCSAAGNSYNFGDWDNWARTKSINKNVKVYIGVPGSPSAAGGGYVDQNRLQQVVAETRDKFPKSMGGVMMWDASQAFNNPDGQPHYAGAISHYMREASEGARKKTMRPKKGKPRKESKTVKCTVTHTLNTYSNSTEMLGVEKIQESSCSTETSRQLETMAPSAKHLRKQPHHFRPHSNYVQARIDPSEVPSENPLLDPKNKPNVRVEYVPLPGNSTHTRTLVRVRTKDYPMRRNWKLKFLLRPEERIVQIDRGIFTQDPKTGTIVVQSDSEGEPRYKMALWFEVVGRLSDITAQTAKLPDPGTAEFDTWGD